MPSLKDVVVGLDFESQPTHVIDFDPAAETIQMEGRNGKYSAIPVLENGKKFMLSLSNKKLVARLQQVDKKCRLSITRSGSSYDTKYEVKVVG